MPSILSRLRMRTLSQQSNSSAQSATLSSTPTPGPPPGVPTLSPSRSEPLLVDRRIIEDLPALLGSLEATVTPNPAGALKPRSRKRSGLRTLGFGLKDSPAPAEDAQAASEKENNELSAIASPAGPSAWKGKQGTSRVPSTASPWSTFGRHRKRTAKSPYGHGSSHPPSARSSRMASVDSAALRGSPMGNVGEGHTISNLASSASIDHNSNSRPTDSSRDLSVLSVLAGSLSNQSSPSHKSAAITFGRQSPPLDVFPALAYAEIAYTSMPVLPSSYSTENVTSRGNTFPRRHKRRRTHSRSRSQHRDMPHQFTTAHANHDITSTDSDVRVPHETLHGGGTETVPREEHPRSGCLTPDGAGERRLPSAITDTPHAFHASTEVSERPCSPSRLIPLSLSSSTSPSPLLDAEVRSDGVPDNLSRSSPYSPDLREESWMAKPHDAASTLSRQPSDTTDTLRRGSSIASRTGTPSRTRSKRTSHLSEQSIQSTSSSSKQNGGAGPSTAAFPTISPPSSLSQQRVPRTPRTASEPGLRSVSEKSVVVGPVTPTNNKGKRKAEDVDLTPPEQRTGQHTTFVIPPVNRRSPHASEVSRALSSYQGRKRARLSASPAASPGHSRPASDQRHPTDSWSRGSAILSLHRATSKTTSTRSARPESMGSPSKHGQVDRRRSMSEISFPISALVAPHAPSVSIRSGGYYMRDPRKPPREQPTPWTLRMRSEDENGSPSHAWMFFIGFIIFPLWWFASFWRIPQTRQVGGTDTEKAVTLDDPQVEHDARSWRSRCRVMSVVSLCTYIPFIILVAIFVPRN